MTTTTPASTRPRGRRHRRRLVTTLVTLALALTTLAACEPDVAPPFWTLGPKLADVTPKGPHVVLDWRDAVGATRYQVQAALVTSGGQGPWLNVPMDVPAGSACLVVGLDAPREYRFRITAYDAAGNWSG
ncbi:MAG TPA: fibronectin type III domain-containing protein, partial [Iamia sp.]|nr:fibronectin type III domain-containing protein [Iamia sp.]